MGFDVEDFNQTVERRCDQKMLLLIHGDVGHRFLELLVFVDDRTVEEVMHDDLLIRRATVQEVIRGVDNQLSRRFRVT